MTNTFRGFSYPIQKSAGGYFSRSSGVDQIKADLLILLLTSPGERIMLPDFGTPLKDLIFDPNDALIVDRAKDMIASSIDQWEPRVTVDQIEVTVGGDRAILSPYDDLAQSDAILTIRIQFRSEDNIAEFQDLVLEVPLPSGS
jgi:phage baseplate assembly protein W